MKADILLAIRYLAQLSTFPRAVNPFMDQTVLNYWF